MALYVNSEKIEDQQIQAEAERLRPQYEQLVASLDSEDTKKQLHDWSRENLIEQALLRQAARRDKKQLPGEMIDHAYQQAVEQHGSEEEFLTAYGLGENDKEKVREDIAERIRFERLIAGVTGNIGEPTEKAILKYYEKNSDKFAIPEMVRAAHIVKHPKQGDDPEKIRREMQDILAEIRSGTGFDEMASKNSDCPENAGDLGLFAKGMMVQSFDDVVFNMEPGQVSDVFQTEFGFHIVKVSEKKPSVPCPLEDVREIIIRELKQESSQKAIEKFIDAEKAKALIEEK